ARWPFAIADCAHTTKITASGQRRRAIIHIAIFGEGTFKRRPDHHTRSVENWRDRIRSDTSVRSSIHINGRCVVLQCGEQVESVSPCHGAIYIAPNDRIGRDPRHEGLTWCNRDHAQVDDLIAAGSRDLVGWSGWRLTTLGNKGHKVLIAAN